MHEASGLCRNVRYRINGDLGEYGYCHSTNCQKASGSAHGANAGVDRSDGQILAAERRWCEIRP